MTETTISAAHATAPVDCDVLIVGGGVNGAGLFRDLSLQGLKCVIIDDRDFGSGTSAAPSRLIHGGIKYLETGELRLVAQSTLERNLLLRNAPHCVEALPTFIPSFSMLKGAWAAIRTLFGSTTAPRSRGAVLIKIGLAMYDFYGSRHQVMPKHRFFLREGALREMPEITPRVVAGGVYYDAKITRPERLVWELVRDGLEANHDCSAHNFTVLQGAENGIVTFLTHGGETLACRPAIVVNAAGPWIDRVNTKLGERTKLIGGTKGSHILLRHPELVRSLNGRMIYFEADDGRICLVYEYLGLAMVGSTDIKSDDPDHVKCEDDEIDYFLASLKSLLPRLEFKRDQIVYTYSGIRPLPASDASQPGLISRDHSSPILEGTADRPFPIVNLVGGKWTTFRGFAEEVADHILPRLSRRRKVSTQAIAIGGGRDFPADRRARSRWIADRQTTTGLSADMLDGLLTRYGTTADAILDYLDQTGGTEPLTGIPTVTKGEIDWICRNEMIVHLGDIVMRRTTLAIEGLLTRDALEDISRIAANVLSWDEVRREREVQDVLENLRTFHGMAL